jgi:arylsulfatase A-like enzyme
LRRAGDVIEELDWCVGEILATLERHKLADNTLVLFSSDNGPVIDDGYADGAVRDLGSHRPAGPLRGTKYSLYEGGTRVPFLASWPSEIRPGVSDALVCHIDLFASLAALVGEEVPKGGGPDSENVLAALLGKSPVGRDHLVEHANGLAIRKGPWKLIPSTALPTGPAAKKAVASKKATGPSSPELYNLGEDLGEAKNVAPEHPAVVRELTALLDGVRNR